MTDEQRLIAIETKIAFQEDLLQTLDQRVISQQRLLDEFEIQMHRVVQKLAAIETNSEVITDERPPHY